MLFFIIHHNANPSVIPINRVLYRLTQYICRLPVVRHPEDLEPPLHAFFQRILDLAGFNLIAAEVFGVILHPVEPVPALIVLRQLVEILARLPVDSLVGEDGCETFAVIFLILYASLQRIYLSYTKSSQKRL